MVATARFSDIPAEAIRRQADLFLDAFSLRIANEQLTNITTTLTFQVTENFEELAFLRSMATQLVLDIRGGRLEETIHVLLSRLSTTLRAKAVVLVLPSTARATLPNTDELWASEELLDKTRLLTLCDDLADRVLQSTIIENHFQTLEFAGSYPEIRELIGVEVADETSVGWLFAINRALPASEEPVYLRTSEQQFGTVEASLMTCAVSLLATHFHNVELLKQKEDLFTEIVRALVNAVEAKDAYLCGHSERVALFSKRLAQQVKLEKEACDNLYLSGLLHDVGKIAISDSALNKPGELTVKEFAEVRRHPEEAWSILYDLQHLRDVLPAVLFHHERYDGEGYPDGLNGQTIPLEGRIMAICDAFDAMTSDRPYRSGIPVEKAASILQSGSGTQWDPTLIDEFLGILPEINKIRQEYEPRTLKSRHDLP